MKSLFHRIINTGVQSHLDFFLVREIRLVNFFAYATILALSIGFTSIFFINGKYPSLIVFQLLISSIICVVLNKFKFYAVATYFLIVPLNINLFFLNQSYDENVGNYMYYFLIIYCIAVLHNPGKSAARSIIFFIITFGSFLLTKFIHVPDIKLSGITNTDEELLLIYNQVLCFALAIILVFQAVRLINKQNLETLTLLEKEKQAQRIINQSLKEKEVLLAEIQHRVKNNLAIIASLVRLQSDKAKDNQSKVLFKDTENRVISMSMVHDKLYSTKDLNQIDLSLYLTDLIAELVNSFTSSQFKLTCKTRLEPVSIELTRAVPIGLIVNEALTNSLKHAFKEENKHPELWVELLKTNSEICLKIADNGSGFEYPVENKTVLGISLIQSLAQQIDAKTLFNTKDGTEIIVKIPV